jgi:CheY-like chemotaxis protein
MANKVLIVDDDVLTVKLYSEYLDRLGYEVRTSLSADESIEKSLSIKPNLILMDIRFNKGISGVEAATIIKSLDECINIPIIAISAYSFDNWQHDHLFVEKIEKPVTIDKLREILSKYLANDSACINS